MSGRLCAMIGAALGFLAVSAGAFGAHGLKSLPTEQLAWWKTGSEYAVYHALALVLTGLLASRTPSRATKVSAIGFGLGVLLFSGSLWIMALTAIKKLGMITPLGGLGFLVGWAALAVAARRLPASEGEEAHGDQAVP